MTQEQVTPEAIPVIEAAKPVEELSTQLTQLQANSRQIEESLQRERKVTGKQSTRIHDLEQQLITNQSQADINKALIAMLSAQKGQPSDEFEEEVKQRQPDLVKQFEKVVAESQKQQQVNLMMSRINEIKSRTEELGITPDSDDYEIIRTFAEAGKFDKAEKKLETIEKAKQIKPLETEKPKETEQERVDRLVNERLQKELVERGLLTQETGGPSASPTTRQKRFEAYWKGELPVEEFKNL